MVRREESALIFLMRMFVLVLSLSFMVTNCSCSSSKNLRGIYEVSGEMSVFDESVGGSAFRFCFKNKSYENVKNFVLVVGLLDSDGEPAFFDRDFLEYEVLEEIGAGEEKEFVIPLDEYFETEVETEYWTDFLYVRRIEFESGRIFEDAFGFYYL